MNCTAKTPKVSIGMPLYNAERYLRLALGSLLSQTFSDFELVISDNGSTDGTEAICRQYAALDPRIKYHRHDRNRGAVWNFNRVFELSCGEYFKWAAYDDVCDPEYLKKCLTALEADPRAIWCHSQTLHMDADGNVVAADADPCIPPERPAHSLLWTDGTLPSQTRSSQTPHERFAAVLLGTTWCSDSFGLIRSDALRRTRLYLPCYGPEKVLMGELALLGRYVEVPEVLFFERIHGEASGAIRSAKEQRRFAGGNGGGFTSSRWKLLQGHCTAVWRAPLPVSERLRCSAALIRYVGQFHKWRRIVAQAWSGAALGSETRTELDQRVATAPDVSAGTTEQFVSA